MGKLKSEFEVTCPCCKSALVIDVNLGRIISHREPERTDKPAWAHPVVANGKLYIRDQDTLFCYDLKAK